MEERFARSAMITRKVEIRIVKAIRTESHNEEVFRKMGMKLTPISGIKCEKCALNYYDCTDVKCAADDRADGRNVNFIKLEAGE